MPTPTKTSGETKTTPTKSPKTTPTKSPKSSPGKSSKSPGKSPKTSPSKEYNKNIISLLKKFVEIEKPKNPVFEIKRLSQKGDGYMGIIDSVAIKTEDGKEWNVVAKTATKDEEFRKNWYTGPLFKQEMLFYYEIFPMFKKFQLEKNIDNPFLSVAECYPIADNEEGIIMENLMRKGYKMYNRMIPMNEEHIIFTLKQYAKFHAISYAMKDQRRDDFEKIKKILKMDIIQLYYQNESHMTMYEDTVRKNIDILDNIKEKRYKQKVKNYVDTREWDYIKVLSKNMDEYGVITHADPWCNNMMYKYEDQENEEIPSSMYFLDFQMVRYATPILDITHFFYTASPRNVLDNYRKYLDIYYKSLSDFIKVLGSNPEVVYPRSKFDEHWKKYRTNGLNAAMFMIKVMSSTDDEVPDFNNPDMSQEMDYQPKNEGYVKRLKNVIMHFCDQGFI